MSCRAPPQTSPTGIRILTNPRDSWAYYCLRTVPALIRTLEGPSNCDVIGAGVFQKDGDMTPILKIYMADPWRGLTVLSLGTQPM